MSKAILIMDMPKSCCFCNFCYEKDGEKFCLIEDDVVEKYFYAAFQEEYIKPNWCPLKEVPMGIDAYVPEEVDYYSYRRGWYDCKSAFLDK